MPRVGLFL